MLCSCAHKSCLVSKRKSRFVFQRFTGTCEASPSIPSVDWYEVAVEGKKPRSAVFASNPRNAFFAVENIFFIPKFDESSESKLQYKFDYKHLRMNCIAYGSYLPVLFRPSNEESKSSRIIDIFVFKKEKLF